jgi:hypothetical protein
MAMLIFNMGPLPERYVLKVEDRNDLLNPGYLPAEQGYGILADGSGYIEFFLFMAVLQKLWYGYNPQNGYKKRSAFNRLTSRS